MFCGGKEQIGGQLLTLLETQCMYGTVVIKADCIKKYADREYKPNEKRKITAIKTVTV